MEKQNIEYKSIWKDKYLISICAFANTVGGKLFIGKDDSGNTIDPSKPNANGIMLGLTEADAIDLLDKIPKKITTLLGIVAEVNFHTEQMGNYIEITVVPYHNAISYDGNYYVRQGSSNQILKGSALTTFLLKKQGLRWDSVPVSNAKISDLKQETFDFFRKKGIDSKRLDKSSIEDSNEVLLKNLKLIDDDGNLKRATALLFHPDPEKFVTGAFIKIGYFETDSDLLFQDVVQGNLFEQIERTMELLLTKYTKALISYKGLSRIETYEYPEEALREALLNSVTHKNYAGCTPIQISVYSDKIMIWNMGQLPENWTIDMLQKKHSSVPFNPDIANAFFRSGYVEAWGRGIEKINKHCASAGLPLPSIYYDHGGYWVVFHKKIDVSNLNLNERQIDALEHFKGKGEITSAEYAEKYSVSDRTARRDLSELSKMQLVENKGDTNLSKYIFP